MNDWQKAQREFGKYPPLRQGWERKFRAAARSDNYALFRDHMRRLGLPDPKLMLEGTIRVVQARWVFANLDGWQSGPFLEMQKYNPSQAIGARYAFTFDLCGKAFARVLVNTEVGTLDVDLADLFCYPWGDYKVVGFWQFWISHLDWTCLTSEELEQLEDHVTDDLLFDYGEDELNFWFDASPDNSFLLVGDVVELEEAEEGEYPD